MIPHRSPTGADTFDLIQIRVTTRDRLRVLAQQLGGYDNAISHLLSSGPAGDYSSSSAGPIAGARCAALLPFGKKVRQCRLNPGHFGPHAWWSRSDRRILWRT